MRSAFLIVHYIPIQSNTNSTLTKTIPSARIYNFLRAAQFSTWQLMARAIQGLGTMVIHGTPDLNY